MTKEIRHVVTHNRFAWSLDDIIIPLIELWVLYYFAQRGYNGFIDSTALSDKAEGALILLAAVIGGVFFLLRFWQLNSFVVIETPLDMESNFIFCLDRVKMFNIDKREFDKWNYCVGVRAHGDINPLPFWLTMICYENRVYINERPAFYLLSLWWTRSGLDKMADEVKMLRDKGKAFADVEVEKINISMAEHQLAVANGTIEPTAEDPWERNIVVDKNAPAYYSRQAISSFSFFFTALAGAILLSFNVSSRSDKLKVIICGAVYSFISVFALSILPKSLVFVFWANSLGAGFVSTMLWNKFVSKDAKHRARPAWLAFVIALAIFLPLFLIFVINY